MKRGLYVGLVLLMVTGMASFVAGKENTGMDAVRLMDAGRTDEALQILENLAADGDDKSMVQLGVYYYEGTGVKQDYAKAMDWWLKAMTNQNADAFVNLGVIGRNRRYGIGLPS